MSTALPPADFWPAVFVAYPVLVFSLEANIGAGHCVRKKLTTGFATGWLFGFGYFVTSLYWIGAAFLVEPDKFAVLMPFAVAALPAFLAIFWGLATGLASIFNRSGFTRALLLAVVLTLAEWLRGHVLTGFPWNVIGLAGLGMGDISQLAAIGGVYGLTFLILVWAATGVALFDKPRKPILTATLALSFLFFWLAGGFVTSPINDKHAQAPLVRIVQPNVVQTEKWVRAYRQRNIDRLFTLSAKPVTGETPPPKIIIWPESALPILYENSPVPKQRVADLLTPGRFLIMGATRREQSGNRYIYFNSILVADHTGSVVARYDKSHLVPFGEYLPYKSFFEKLGLRKLVTLPGAFHAGSGSKLLDPPGIPAFVAAICYEIIFPSQINAKHKRPNWIINVTNDGWFGHTAGPYQHLAQARLRAIEQGLPVVRAANTGISAVISPSGHIVQSLDLGKTGVVDVRLPTSLNSTLYSKYEDTLIYAILVCILIIITIVPGIFKLRKTPDHEQ